MNKKVSYMLGMLLAGALFTSCKNGDADFPDYEGGTTVYFPYQTPVRTIVLGDDEYDTTLDKLHMFQIKATFGGSRSGSNGNITVVKDPTLLNNLTFEATGQPVKLMPDSYYDLPATTKWEFNGTYNASVEIELSDDFFNDPDAVKNTYVIPLRMISVTGIDHILTGTPREGLDPVRTDLESWETPAKDYVLYCVRYRNAWHANYIRRGVDEITQNGTTSKVVRKDFSLVNTDLEHYTENPVNANDEIATITTVGEKVARFTPSFKTSGASLPCNLLLTFNGDKCTISTDDANVDVTGEGEYITQGTTLPEYKDYIWGHNNGEQVHRDILRLKYTIDFKDKNIQVSTCDTMVVRDRDSNKKVFFNTKYVKQ